MRNRPVWVVGLGDSSGLDFPITWETWQVTPILCQCLPLLC